MLALLTADAPNVVVNVQGLTFIDVAGLRALSRAAGSARRAGSRLVITGATASFDRLLHQTGMDAEVALFDPSR